MIAEYDGDSNLIVKYEHGIGLVSRIDDSNNQAFYDFDGTGSTQAEILLEEDQSWDSEIAHTEEIVDFLAIAGSGDLIATAYELSELI